MNAGLGRCLSATRAPNYTYPHRNKLYNNIFPGFHPVADRLAKEEIGDDDHEAGGGELVRQLPGSVSISIA